MLLPCLEHFFALRKATGWVPGAASAAGSRGIASQELLSLQKGFPNCSVKSRFFPCQSWSAQLGNVTPLVMENEGIYPSFVLETSGLAPLLV